MIKEFVKSTNDTRASKDVAGKSLLYGTAVVNGDVTYVKIDGSSVLTPVGIASAADNGDRVVVSISNHKATILGNITSPASAGVTTKTLQSKAVDEDGNPLFFIDMETGQAVFRRLDADALNIANAEIERLVAAQAAFETATTENFTATNAVIEELKSTVITTENLSASVADLGYLTADRAELTYATITDLEVTNAYVTDLMTKAITTENLSASVADLGYLSADQAALTYARIDDLKATSAKVALLESDIIAVENLSAKKADIDFANVIALDTAEAVIQNLLVKGGIMTDDITAVTGEFTKYLTGVNISGDLINAGTISTERLIIRSTDTDEGILFAINDAGEIDQTELTAEELKRLTLDGKLITAGTITADKIAVTDLSAFNATIGGFKLTKASVYSSNEKIILNSDGTFKLGDGIQYDGTDMMIAAKTITMGGKGLATETDVRVLQEQIDEKTQTFFNNYVPTLTTEPASGWDAADYDAHLGDLFYIVNNDEKNGQTYRFALIDGTYQWIRLSDAELTKALNDASDALGTADSANVAAGEAKIAAGTATVTANVAKSTAENATAAAANAQSTANGADNKADAINNTLSSWFVFSDTSGLIIGKQGINSALLRLANDKIQFLRPGANADDSGEFADSDVLGYWDILKNEFTVGNLQVEVERYARFGNYSFIPKTDGSLQLKKVV